MFASTSLPTLLSANHKTRADTHQRLHTQDHNVPLCYLSLLTVASLTHWTTSKTSELHGCGFQNVVFGLQDDYICFGGTYCLHLQDINGTPTLKNKAASSPTFTPTYGATTRRTAV